MTEIKYSSRDIECLENLLKKYVDALIKNINKQFRNAAPVLTAMQVFDKTATPPKESADDFVEYGLEHTDVLARHYFPGDAVNQERLQAEWKLLKYDLFTWKLPQTVKDGRVSCAECFMQQLVKQKFSYQAYFPLMVTVVEALLVIPVSNAWPARGGGGIEGEVNQEPPAEPSKGGYAKCTAVYQLKWPTGYFRRWSAGNHR